MPPPRRLEPLPEIPHLPHPLRWLAGFVVTCPRSSPDYLYLLADALDEAGKEAEQAMQPAKVVLAIFDLTTELRRRAPEYA